MVKKIELKEIEVSKIYPNWFQPRKSFEKEKIKELAESILSNGLINPITVKVWRNGYMVVSGERRWRSHKLAKLKTINAFVKEYKDDGQFMIESLIENIHREDLSSTEKAFFIKKIWKQMGKPLNKKGNPDSYLLGKRLGMTCDEENHQCQVVIEHLSLVDVSTPKEVKKAVEKGKLAMRSASIIKKLPEKEQEAIAKEAMKRETGMGRTEIQELVKEPIPEPIKLERTANNIGDDILLDMSNLDYHITELMEDVNPDDLTKSKMQRLMTTSGLIVKKHIGRLVNFLNKKGVKPDPIIMALMKANGKI